MRAIIFDFDGTIADSFKLVIEIAHELTHRSQLVLPEEVDRLRSLRLMDVAKELRLPRYRWPFLLLLGRRRMAKRLNEVMIFPGIDTVLLALHADRYQLFIMSSNSTASIETFLTARGLSAYFTKVYGGVSLLGKAPALRSILKLNQLANTDAIYVGDEPRDIEAAKKVGMPCVAVSWGYNTPELLAEHAPMVVARTPEQLQKVVEEWGSNFS